MKARTLLLVAFLSAICSITGYSQPRFFTPSGLTASTTSPGSNPNGIGVGLGMSTPIGIIDIAKGDLYFRGDPVVNNAFVIHHQYWAANGMLKISPAISSTGAMTNTGWEFLYNGEFRSYGKIWAPEVEVKLPPFPDYVFEEDYDLKSINELESFIKENKHLPGIPSAENIKENGIGVGALQVKLMEKVEELTLYVIMLNAKNEQLQKDIEAMKSTGQK